MNFQHSQYLILSSGTDIGKTFFVTKICDELRRKNIAVDAIKPVASGFREGDLESDSAKILQSLGRDYNKENLDDITPWRFKTGLAPSLAANKENIPEIDFLALKKFCLDKINFTRLNSRFLLIEGAGGVMTPINSKQTFLDLAAELKIPILFLGGNYLGSISHILSALEALRSRGCKIEKIIINDHNNQNSDVKLTDTIAQIGNFCDVEILAL